MLMAAVTSTSLNTETTSIRSVPSGNTESTGMSFVDSLAENTAHVEERPFDVGDGAKPMNAVERDGIPPGKTTSAKISAVHPEVKSEIGVAKKSQDEAENVKSLVSSGIGSATDTVTNKTKPVVTGTVLQSGGKSSETDAASQTARSDDKPMPVIPGAERNPRQALVHDDTDGIEDSDPQIADPVAAVRADANGMQETTGKNEKLVSGEGQNSAATVAKDHDTSMKTEKSSKAEAKRDKKDKPGIAVITAGVDAQATASVQVLVNSAGAQQSAVEDAEAGVLPSASAVASTRSAGTMAVANSRNNKVVANGKKPDESSVKAADPSSLQNPLSQKTESDVAKPELGTTINPDSEKSKLQSTVTSVTDIGQFHTVSVTPGSTSSVVTGNGPTHNVGAGLHSTDATSHATATAQASPNFIDTASADAAHKTLMATPTSLEVGVANGTHGWLKIRAEMADGGAVNTSLSTSSTAGQEMLHRELPSLAAYLKSEHVAVNAVVVQPIVATGSDHRGSFAGASGSEHGQAQQGGSQRRDDRQNPANPTPASSGLSTLYSSSGAVGEDEILPSLSYVQGRGWLSVRA